MQSLRADLEEVSHLLVKDRDHDERQEGTTLYVDDSESSDDDEEPLTDVEITAFEIQSRLDHVSDVITKLCRLARVIRASGVRSRTIKAANYEHYEDGINQTKIFEEQYLPSVLRHRFQLNDPLLSRMCKVIALRRRRFLYQMTHQKGLAYGVRVEKSSAAGVQPTDNAATPIPDTCINTTPHLSSDRVQPPSAAQPFRAPSAITRPTRATTFQDLSRKRRAPSTLVASTARLAMGSTDIPPAPVTATRASHFQCPYCYLLVEQHKATPTAWRKHVVNDLQPFVCIESNCNDPHVVMETWTDWVEHHRWAHAMEWWCEGLEAKHQPTRFTAAEDYSEHLLHDHMSTLTIRDVSRRVQTSGAPAQEPFRFCPFCDYEADNASSPAECDVQSTLRMAKLGQKKLQSHIFNHLLSMFLLALPGRDDIEDEGSEDEGHEALRSSIVTGNKGSSRSAASRPLSSFTDCSATLSDGRPGGAAEFNESSLDRTASTGKVPRNDSSRAEVTDGTNTVNSFQEDAPRDPEPPATNTLPPIVDSKQEPDPIISSDLESYQGMSNDYKASGVAELGAKNQRGKDAPPHRCHSCKRTETPAWRRGPDGARTLCNACGLHYAKLTRKLGVKKAEAVSQQDPSAIFSSQNVPATATQRGASPLLSFEDRANERSARSNATDANLRQDGSVEYNHAINYVDKIKRRFTQQPGIYNQFLEIMQAYHREQKPLQDVYDQVTQLFHSAPDLIEDFKMFMPETAAQAEAAQASATSASAEEGERKYCYCQKPAHGEMLACDDEDCTFKWFHLSCLDLDWMPTKDKIWYCAACRAKRLLASQRLPITWSWVDSVISEKKSAF